MDSYCHTTVAKYLLSYLEQKYGVTFDRKAFYFGNLKPDLKGEYLTKRHYPSLMFEEVMQKIRDFNENNEMGQDNDVQLSEDLGEICHYMTDFFSFPHNDTIYERGLFAHYVYEKRTAIKIRGQLSEERFAGWAERSCACLPNTTDQLIRELKRQHSAYALQTEHGIADDIEQICCVLTMMLCSLLRIHTSYEQKEKTA